MNVIAGPRAFRQRENFAQCLSDLSGLDYAKMDGRHKRRQAVCFRSDSSTSVPVSAIAHWARYPEIAIE